MKKVKLEAKTALPRIEGTALTSLERNFRGRTEKEEKVGRISPDAGRFYAKVT